MGKINVSKLKVAVEEARTVRQYCDSLIIVHFEQALVEEQIAEILTILQSLYDGEIKIIQTLVTFVDWTLNFHENEKCHYQRICLLSLVTTFDQFLI